MKEWVRPSDKLIKFLIKYARPLFKWSFKSGAGSGYNVYKHYINVKSLKYLPASSSKLPHIDFYSYKAMCIT